MSEQQPTLEARLDAAEAKLVQFEVRGDRVFYNLWTHRRDRARRRASIAALLTWLLSPGTVAGAGASALAIVGVVVALQANSIISDQNRLIREQNESLRVQNGDNLRYQRLNRRTHLLSVIYAPNEVPRTKREALLEFLELDQALKRRQLMDKPDRYHWANQMMRNSADTANWSDIVTLFPELRTDLSHAVLRDLNMERFDLSYSILIDADLSCSNLGHANLTYSDLTRAEFIGAPMGGAELDGATATGADFTGARLNGASLAGTWLEDAVFDRAFLWKARFSKFINDRDQPGSPGSAKDAYVRDLWDYDGSGGAQRFQEWAFRHGAMTSVDYTAWRSRLSQEQGTAAEAIRGCP